jgi:hypothetical protein
LIFWFIFHQGKRTKENCFRKNAERVEAFWALDSCLAGFALLKLCESDTGGFALLLIKLAFA